MVRFGSVADIEEYVKRSSLAAQLPEFIALFQELDARLSRQDIADFEELAKSASGRHVLDMRLSVFRCEHLERARAE